MKKLFLLVLSTAFIHTLVLAESRCYSLPSRSAIAVDGESVVHVDRVDIFAKDDSIGHYGSPFRIIGYDKDRKVVFDRVFARENKSTNELANVCQQAGVSTTIVQDELSISDSFYSLSAKKSHGEFLVVVLNMSKLRNEIPNSLACTNRQAQAKVTVDWPKTDEDRQLYYHQDLQTLNLLQPRDVAPEEREYLHLNAALYQNRSSFSIRFVLSRMKGVGETIADGRLVGKIAGDEINDKSVTYGSGEGLVAFDVELLPDDETSGADISESERGPLERAGLKHRTARLNVSYGAMKIRMEMRVIVDWTE